MGKRIMRDVIKRLFSWWWFSSEAEGLRQKWYRDEIINAYESHDFEQAAILGRESERG